MRVSVCVTRGRRRPESARGGERGAETQEPARDAAAASVAAASAAPHHLRCRLLATTAQVAQCRSQVPLRPGVRGGLPFQALFMQAA